VLLKNNTAPLRPPDAHCTVGWRSRSIRRIIPLMTPSKTIPRDYDEAVRLLAEWHAGINEPDLEIYCFPDPSQTT